MVDAKAPTHDDAGVGTRHETDMPTALRNVRYQGQSGKHVLALSFSGFDPGCVKTLKFNLRGEILSWFR